ncbi:MAG: glycoside hydrolase family 31 protein [bacterium]
MSFPLFSCLRTLSLVLLLIVPVRAEKIPVSSWKKDANGVTLSMNPGTLRLNVCNERGIRVIYTPSASIPELQDVVQIRKWEPVDFSVKESLDTIAILTAQVTAIVNKATGAVGFQDARGTPLLSEWQQGGRLMNPRDSEPKNLFSIEQRFNADTNEFLYGMGQYQEGVWNWRGMPLELRQQNTQIVVPMMLSSRGYGLLWNNASWSFLNPCDTVIPLQGNDLPKETGVPKATEDLAAAALKVGTNGATASPTPKPTPKPLAIHTGSFTPQESGEFVFFASNGNRSQELSIQINSNTIAGITNMWTPYAISGVSSLKAGEPVSVTVRGGGDQVVLSVRPKQDDRTIFRSSTAEVLDYTFFYGPSLETVIAGYREATGAAPLLPRWAYGFWQCRERYNTQQELIDAVEGYRSRHLPVDLIVQDWFYWGKYGWGSYQMEEARYPDPKAMIQAVHDHHMKYMVSVWPNPHGKAGDALKVMHGVVGNSSYYDPTNPDARSLRWEFLNEAFFSIGTDAWWQDAAEPGDDGNSMEGAKIFLGSGSLWRNAYPLFHSQCIFDGQRATNPEKRVCNLTRSAFLGQQRYATVAWSGDVGSDWTTFRRQIAAGLNFCMAGIPYWTTDCGGFFRRGTQSPDANETQIRWFEWSTFSPILRIHGYKTHTEFWNWLPETQRILTDYDKFRYRMLPYNYSVAWQVTSSGSTIMRALPMDFREDPAALAISDEYCFGPSLLVAPVTEAKADHRQVYLPKGCDWYDFWSGDRVPGGSSIKAAAPVDRIPLYAKAGAIIPLGPEMEWNDQKPCDPIELRIYLGADGAFILYEDEGDSYRYEKGDYSTIPISWSEKDQTLTIGDRKGSFPQMLQEHTFHVVWVAPGHGIGMSELKADQEVAYKGKAIQIKKR